VADSYSRPSLSRFHLSAGTLYPWIIDFDWMQENRYQSELISRQQIHNFCQNRHLNRTSLKSHGIASLAMI